MHGITHLEMIVSSCHMQKKLLLVIISVNLLSFAECTLFGHRSWATWLDLWCWRSFVANDQTINEKYCLTTAYTHVNYSNDASGLHYSQTSDSLVNAIFRGQANSYGWIITMLLPLQLFSFCWRVLCRVNLHESKRFIKLLFADWNTNRECRNFSFDRLV